MKSLATNHTKWGGDKKHLIIPQILAYMVALVAILKAQEILKINTHEQIAEKNCLFLPHPTQVIGILRLLSLGYKDGREKL